MDINELFKKDKRESAVDIVVNNIKQLLIERKLKPGDRLPSELEISEGMGVSRGSVREAMKILTAFGLVDIRVGNGTYICDTPGTKLMDSLLFSFFIANPDTKNLYELRKALEIDVLQLILAHYDENEDDRIALEENLDSAEAVEKYLSDYDRQMIVTSTDIDILVKDFSDIIADGINKTLHPGIYS